MDWFVINNKTGQKHKFEGAIINADTVRWTDGVEWPLQDCVMPWKENK